MLCCLNPACHNPSAIDSTKFCLSCGVPLVILRNRYRPVKFLGGGGFGKTYLAEDIDKLNENCVIKQFAPQVQGKSGLQKATELFKQEARRLQQLGEHPQIPTLLGYFQEDSRLYLVQQFIDGQNLKQLQQQETFTEKKVRDLLQDLLNILKVVHQQKVIHRDIKPENIIQRRDGKVVLIDFGASKQLTKTVMTEQGTTIGSFGYISPEQMQEGKVYPASDLYSLGATCFHLLSGIHPWSLWKSQGYAWVRNWKQYLQQPLSQKMEQILDRLLKEEYQQRYQSAEEVLQDLNLQPISKKQPVTSPAINLQPNQAPLNISNRVKSPIRIFIFAISLLMLMGASAIYFQGLRNNPEAEEMLSTEVENKTVKTLIREGIKKYDRQDFRGAIEDYDQAIQINPKHALAYYNRGNARYELGNYLLAIEDYTQAIKFNPNYVNAYYNRGNTRSKLGDKQAAIEDYSQVIQINPSYTLAYFNRGNARNDLGNKKAAIKNYTKAIKFNPNYADAYFNRGNTRSDLGNKQAAIKDYRKAANLYKQQGKENKYQKALNRIIKFE